MFTYHIVHISLHNRSNIRVYDTCEATCTCHHTTYSYNQTDSKTTYLVGLSRRFHEFEYVRFPFLEHAPSIAGCHFLLECPSHFVSNSNLITQFNLNREIECYTSLNYLNQSQFQLRDGWIGGKLAIPPLPSWVMPEIGCLRRKRGALLLADETPIVQPVHAYDCWQTVHHLLLV